MVFAIASVLAFRSRLTLNHPYGYFLTAQKYQERVAVLGSLEAIQNLLLIARFGMYHEINTSLWELSQICIRQCIELNLHLPPREPITIQMDQLRRCVFWDCYMNERYSAGTLGRPFSIADQNIEVALPYELTDEELLSMGSHNSVLNPANRASTIPNDKSVFLFAVGLRRIQSQNKSAFRAHAYNTTVAAHRRFSVSTVGVIACELEDHLRELDSWLSGAPVFPSPKNTYQHQDWYAFLTEKEKLSIIRAAMACLSQSQTRVPRIFLKECATSAIKVIQLFTAMFDAERITWTRSYFQVLFVAGLSLMFCLSVHTGDREDDLTDPLTEYLTKGSASGETSALDMCSRVLLRLSKEMPDSRAFYLIFEVLTRRFDVERTTSGRDRDAMVARGAASLYNQQSSHQLPSVSMNRPASGQNNPVPRSDPNASSSVREQYNQARHLSRNNEQEQLAIGAIPSSDHHTSTASLLTPSSWRRHQDYTTTEQSTGMMESVHTRMDLPSSPSVEIQVPGWLSASSQYQSESIEFVHPGWGAAQATEDTAASSSAPPLPISASQIADASISSGLDDYNMDWSMTFTDEAMDEMVASLGEYVWGDTGATRVWGDLDIQM
ncbi:hypothetical protein BX600DRAFT_151374 [Xylariales sp. PMI_506]|nr:hypothetical protein BX600DRAFT_151374 [Xylariales sp. PMI_506]